MTIPSHQNNIPGMSGSMDSNSVSGGGITGNVTVQNLNPNRCLTATPQVTQATPQLTQVTPQLTPQATPQVTPQATQKARCVIQ